MNRSLRPRGLPVVVLLVMVLASCGNGSTLATEDRGPKRTAPSEERGDSPGEGVSEGDSRDDSGKRDAGAAGGVMVIDTAFKPRAISVTAGSNVVWNQIGKQPHSVTSTDERFDSSPDCSPIEVESCLEEGSKFSETFDKPGTYRYYCRVHGLPDGTGMVGTITVR